MAAQSSTKSIDLQRVISGAAELEVKALLAGVEYLQVWIGQAARLASIANETLQSIQDDKASLADTARKLTDFGKQNAEVFTDLSNRMSQRFFGELDRLAVGAASTAKTASARVRAAAVKPVSKTVRPKRVKARRSKR
jgi:hypothetical protein